MLRFALIAVLIFAGSSALARHGGGHHGGEYCEHGCGRAGSTIITTPATGIIGGVIVTAPVNMGRGINERTQCAVSMTTASRLPPNCRPVKASTVVTFSRMGSLRVPQKRSPVLR